MKKQLLFISNRKAWVRSFRKFRNLYIRIQQLIVSEKLTEDQFKQLAKKIKKAYQKLEQLQFNSGLRVAGTSLAIMLAATTLSAQNFIERTGAANPLDGTYAPNTVPAFIDIDNDTDLDVFISEVTYTPFYENTGNISSPAYTVATSPFGLTLNANSSYHVIDFVDIDNDGDFDAFVGHKAGNIKFWENTGTNSSPVFTAITGAANPLDGEETVDNASPSFIDIDNDGDMDAFIGSSDGTFYFYENTGTPSSPILSAVTGGANPLNGEDIGSNSVPSFIDFDNDGDFDLLAGESSGSMYYYENTGTASAAIFIAQTGVANPLNGINVGQRSTPKFVDIDNDGDYDVFSGNGSGVIKFYENTPASCIVTIPDANFKTYLVGNTAINTNADTEIQCSEASAFTGFISCNGLSISDLTGIETFTSLDALYCNANQLTSLDLSQSTVLTILKCQSNQLNSINVTQNTALVEFDCSNNQLSSLDITQNTGLVTFRCSSNVLTSLDLTNNPLLSYISCSTNQIMSLDITQNTAITSVGVNDNLLISLDISQHTNVTEVYCYNNQLTSLNVANGNNANIDGLSFAAGGNPNLTCIQVDDEVYSTTNWPNIDAGASFSENCGLGINEDLKNEMMIYPNPATAQINIEIDKVIESVKIFNIAGELVMSTNKKTFSIESLSKGVYVMNIQTSNGIVRNRFIKE